MCPLAPSTLIKEESFPSSNQFHGGINLEESMPRKKRPVAKISKKTSFYWMLSKNRKLSEREGLWPLWKS